MEYDYVINMNSLKNSSLLLPAVLWDLIIPYEIIPKEFKLRSMVIYNPLWFMTITGMSSMSHLLKKKTG